MMERKTISELLKESGIQAVPSLYYMAEKLPNLSSEEVTNHLKIVAKHETHKIGVWMEENRAPEIIVYKQDNEYNDQWNIMTQFSVDRTIGQKTNTLKSVERMMLQELVKHSKLVEEIKEIEQY